MAHGRRARAWARLERVLEDRQIDRDTFELQAVRVIRDVMRSTPDRDPATALTELEVETLGAGGLDLAPRGANEPDIVLETATARAFVEAKAATVADVAAALRVTRTRVRQRAAERSLYAIRVDDAWRFPRWQFDDDGRPVPGIASVAAALPSGIHPVAVSRFMSEPNADLEIEDRRVSPITWLRSGGDPGPVAAIARDL